jgi:hypothetical protein
VRREARPRSADEDAGWIFESIAGPDAEVALRSVGISVPLTALYRHLGPAGAAV